MKKVIITRASFLVHANELSNHSNICQCWQLPHGFTLIAFNDPVFQEPNTLHPPSACNAAAIIDEASLFTPFYQNVRSLADLLTLKASTGTVSYHLVTASRTLREWPRLALFAGWETADQFQVMCRFPHRSLSEMGLLDALFLEWQSRMKDLGVLRHFARITFEPATYAVRCAFAHSAADAAMALFMMLSHGIEPISLKSVIFTEPASTSLAVHSLALNNETAGIIQPAQPMASCETGALTTETIWANPVFLEIGNKSDGR